MANEQETFDRLIRIPYLEALRIAMELHMTDVNFFITYLDDYSCRVFYEKTRWKLSDFNNERKRRGMIWVWEVQGSST